MEKSDTIRAERETIYGDPFVCHAAIGAVWGGILTQAGFCPVGTTIPPHIVATMMAGLKIVRSSTRGAPHHQDSYDDAAVYTIFSDEFHPRRTK